MLSRMNPILGHHIVLFKQIRKHEPFEGKKSPIEFFALSFIECQYEFKDYGTKQCIYLRQQKQHVSSLATPGPSRILLRPFSLSLALYLSICMCGVACLRRRLPLMTSPFKRNYVCKAAAVEAFGASRPADRAHDNNSNIQDEHSM